MQNHDSPLVSVGIPTYNRSESLKRAITSVINQTYTNLEIIISDNASTDETQQVCEEFCNLDSRITYIRQFENFGATNNFKVVLEKSGGEYFMWLGDDDWIDDSYISECVKELIENLDYSLVSGKPIYYKSKEFFYHGRSINIVEQNGSDRLLNYYRQVSENGIFYGVMRRNKIGKISIMNCIGGDWFVIAALAFLGKIKTISNVAIHRESNWSQGSFEILAKSFGLSPWQGKYPFLAITVFAIRDIITNTVIYGDLSLFNRLILCLKLFLIFMQERGFQSEITCQFRFHQFNLLRAKIPKWAYPHVRRSYRYFAGSLKQR